MPSEASPPWCQRAGQVLRQLMERPLLLLTLLLAANSVARPYGNIEHDARLYSVQVLNRVEAGSYDDDLFFRYGSQDRFSLFSPMMAPVVQAIGLETAFFLVYLLANVVFIAALVRLVPRLVEDPILAFVALVYLVCAPLNYGGLCIFHVHETFLTPRLLTVGLVLWGLERLLAERHLTSLVLLATGGLLHPLMAMGGLAIWAGMMGVEKLGWRITACIAAAVCLGGVTLLCLPSVAFRLLGTMDDTWRDHVLRGSSFNFLSEWELRDWVNIALCELGLVAGCHLLRDQDPRLARFCLIVGIVGALGLAGTALALQLPYALPFQAQPYRALWILKVLQVPLCFLLAAKLWRSACLPGEIGAVLLFAFFATTSRANAAWPVAASLGEALGRLVENNSTLVLEWSMPLFFLPIVSLVLRGLDAEPHHADWLGRSVLVSLVLGCMTWALYKTALLLALREQLLVHQDTFDLIRTMIANLGSMFWVVLVTLHTTCLVPLAARPPVGPPAVALADKPPVAPSFHPLAFRALCVLTVACTFFFAAPNTQHVRHHYTRSIADMLFARTYIDEHRPTHGKLPNVYSDQGQIELVWLELKATTYFDWWQASGFLFHRDTTMEGQRRALVVAPFEVRRFQERRAFLSEHVKTDIERFFHRPLDAPAPTVDDLARLCAEDGLDFAVLHQAFPGLYSSGNGTVYVYDCRQVRAALHEARSGHTTPLACTVPGSQTLTDEESP